jgi:hypothetical protein
MTMTECLRAAPQAGSIVYPAVLIRAGSIDRDFRLESSYE